MNSVFDKPVEVEVQELSEGIAIVIDGDTAPRAIASGQFLYIKNHSTLPTGGYNATAAIARGDTISSSNVTIDADGIANAIKGNIDVLNSKINHVEVAITTITSVTSLDVLKTGLQNVANGVAVDHNKLIRFYSNFTSNGFFANRRYKGYLMVFEKSGSTATNFTILFEGEEGHNVSVGYRANTWTIEELALNSNFNTGINRSYGSQTNIIGYNSSSNAYTAPRDGYIMVQIWSTDSSLALWMSPSLISVELNTNFRQFVVFASMGSKWHITGSGSNRSAYFVPLIPQFA